ncbi:hypothetical protein IFM46972_04035 [Aspergillus udagawae]|uniref:GCS light chain n=1 Tax=Aspergillus udagawae TaxID=91492 RepID=A0A8H3RVM3_9EURO|nr:hypothetical protein IFM46972_04035 [Aspergillus udagawae]
MTSGGSSVIRHSDTTKSNVELINSLRANFQAAQQLAAADELQTEPTERYKAWTSMQDDTLYIPAIDFSQGGLAEERSQYDITVKLFFLPGIPVSRRCAHTRQAVDLVLKELHVDSIDLLIVSFPGILFDAEDDSEEEVSSYDGSEEPDDFDSIIQSWRTLEGLHEKGMIAQLGVAEFGSDRLARFLPHTKVKPSVDQINLKDCCVVPKSLILYAKQENIQLLTHNDCNDILPVGTTRELLGPREKGAGILASAPDADDGIKGDVEPQWVVKYTAVVKDRGVVENKGYFALADLSLYPLRTSSKNGSIDRAVFVLQTLTGQAKIDQNNITLHGRIWLINSELLLRMTRRSQYEIARRQIPMDNAGLVQCPNSVTNSPQQASNPRFFLFQFLRAVTSLVPLHVFLPPLQYDSHHQSLNPLHHQPGPSEFRFASLALPIQRQHGGNIDTFPDEFYQTPSFLQYALAREPSVENRVAVGL